MKALRLREPVLYQHPAGAVIWVRLKPGGRYPYGGPRRVRGCRQCYLAEHGRGRTG